MPTFDENLRRMMRMQNIFGVPGMSAGAPSMPDPTVTNPMNTQIEGEIYQPESRASEALYDLMQKFPERGSPGFLRKIGASLAGIQGGIPLAQQVLDIPYEQELKDWQARLVPIQAMAALEKQTGMFGLESAKLAERKRAAETSEEIRRKRADVYEFKSRNPNWKLETGEDGFLYAINPQDPSQTFKTDVKSNELSDYDNINLQVEGRLRVAEATGEQARKTEEVEHINRLEELKKRGEITSSQQRELENLRQKGRVEVEGMRGKSRIEAIKARAGLITGSETPLNERRAIANRAQQIKMKNPEWADSIIIEAGDRVTVTPPRLKRNMAEYNRIVNEILGVEPESDEQEFIEVTNPAGKRVKIKSSDIERALKQGYKR